MKSFGITVAIGLAVAVGVAVSVARNKKKVVSAKSLDCQLNDILK